MKEKPTCIIFPDDYSVIGSIDSLKSRGVKMPDDISYAGYDGISIAKTLNMTTYEQDTQSLRSMAAIKLINIIEDSDAKPEQVIISGSFFEGITIKETK